MTVFWSLSSYVASGFINVAGGWTTIVPSYFWSSLVQLTSAVKAKPLTGVQTVLKPTTPTLKSGLQTPGPPNRPTRPRLRPDGAADAADAADRYLGKIAVLQRAVATVDLAHPVRVPVVGIATAEAPSLDRFKTGIHRAGDGIGAGEYGIINRGESDALVSTKCTSATKHRDGGREQALEIVAACTVRIDGLHVDLVARSKIGSLIVTDG